MKHFTSSHIPSLNIVRKHVTKTVFVASCALSLTRQAPAETVHLKNGTVLKGSIVEMNETDLTVDTADIGQVKIKRRTIKSILEDGGDVAPNSGGSSPPSVNINIDNKQTNDQKSEQKVEQKVEQNQTSAHNVEAPKAATIEDERNWKQGIFSRFALGAAGLSLTQDGEEPKDESLKGFAGDSATLHWDLIGFRSASWWAVSLFTEVGDATPTTTHTRNWTNVGLRLDLDFFRSPHGETALSKWYAGVQFGAASVTLTDKEKDDRTVSLSGSSFGFSGGYDYLINRFFGLTGGVTYFGANLTSVEVSEQAKAAGVAEPDVKNSDTNLGVLNIFAGVMVNFDM